MSTKGIYTALSGAMAQTQKLDTIANNIANANTTAFKKDQQVFNEYLTAFEKDAEVIQVPKVPASIESFYDLNGSDKSYVNSAGTYTTFDQGSLKATNNAYDIAFDGEGFLEIADQNGQIQYTRAGQLTLNDQGQLVTKSGKSVLLKTNDIDGNVSDRSIFISGESKLNITENGEVFDGEKKVGQLSVVQFKNLNQIQKIGGNDFKLKEGITSTVDVVDNPKIKQGFLETSNVNIITEMTDMIMAQRVFEGTQKGISIYDSLEEKVNNQIGNTKG